MINECQENVNVCFVLSSPIPIALSNKLVFYKCMKSRGFISRFALVNNSNTNTNFVKQNNTYFFQFYMYVVNILCFQNMPDLQEGKVQFI